MRTASLTVVALSAMLVVGCTSTRRLNVARSGPMTARVVQGAPVDATYTVQVRRANSDDYDSVEETSVHVRPGTPLGFDRDASSVQAFAGDVRFDVPDASDAEVKWYAKKKQPSGFARGAEMVAGGAALVALDAGLLMAESALGDDDDDPTSSHKKKHHHGHPQQFKH